LLLTLLALPSLYALVVGRNRSVPPRQQVGEQTTRGQGAPSDEIQNPNPITEAYVNGQGS
jgi:hypothetical protein